MKRRRLIYDLIRAAIRFIDWLWDRHWPYVLLAMAAAAVVVWLRVVGYT